MNGLVLVLLANFFISTQTINGLFNIKNHGQNGLVVNGTNFMLDGKNFRIMSGSIHYFRIPSESWKSILKKYKNAGLNTVDIYIAWNIHEPSPGNYLFEEEQLNLRRFLQLVQEVGLLAIVRPGPYICAEWDLGGLPSWLLRDKEMKLRSLYPGFIKPMEEYLSRLFEILIPFQYKMGGPIIAFQIENEYGTYGTDDKYMLHLTKIFRSKGLNELFFACDNKEGLGKYALPKNVLQTINFMWKDGKYLLNKLQKIQPNKPVFVTELWVGWFDHWGETRHTVSVKNVMRSLQYVMKAGASFNLYMFHGGTNSGFMNGANANDDGSNYQSTITSYDYDAPIAEDGFLTKKYFEIKRLLVKLNPTISNGKSKEGEKSGTAYGKITLDQEMQFDDLLKNFRRIKARDPLNMESISVTKMMGQAYGYVVYEKSLPNKNSTLCIENARDFLMVFVDQELVYSSYKDNKDLKLSLDKYINGKLNWKLGILVENTGRVNYGKDMDNQRKGLLGKVKLGEELKDWSIYTLSFDREVYDRLTKNKDWRKPGQLYTPALYRGELQVKKTDDTFLIFEGWYKGFAMVNGHNLGRFWNRGPQSWLYVPKQWLTNSTNTLHVFELRPTKATPTYVTLVERPPYQNQTIDFLI